MFKDATNVGGAVYLGVSALSLAASALTNLPHGIFQVPSGPANVTMQFNSALQGQPSAMVTIPFGGIVKGDGSDVVNFNNTGAATEINIFNLDINA